MKHGKHFRKTEISILKKKNISVSLFYLIYTKYFSLMMTFKRPKRVLTATNTYTHVSAVIYVFMEQCH